MAIYMVQITICKNSVQTIVDLILETTITNKTINCKYLTYWNDNKSKGYYFLFEAINKDAVHTILDLIPEVNQQVIEVNAHLTKYYLKQAKGIQDLESKSESHLNHLSLKVIVAFNLNYLLHQNVYEDHKTNIYIKNQFKTIKQIVKKHKGKFVVHQEKSFTCVFRTVTNAIKCALETRKFFLSIIDKNFSQSQIKIAIGVSNPMVERKEGINTSLNNVKHLCCFSNYNQLVVSSKTAVFFKNEGYVLNENVNGIKILSSNEENFILLLMKSLNSKLNIQNFSINVLAMDMGISKSKLYRSIVSLTNLSPQEFIKEYRLIKALKLMEQGSKNLSEIAFETGFGSPSYFSKCFKKRYFISPSKLFN